MRANTIIFAAGMFVIGCVAGFAAGYSFANVTSRKKESENISEEDENEDDVEVADISSDNSTRDPKEDVNYTAYVNKIKEEGYDSEDENEEEAEEDPSTILDEYAEYRKTHQGVIETLKSNEYHCLQSMRDVDYEQKELWYFQETDELADADNNVIVDEDEVVGPVFDKLRFRMSDDVEVYIRNNPMETDFWIHKVVGQTREEFY